MIIMTNLKVSLPLIYGKNEPVNISKKLISFGALKVLRTDFKMTSKVILESNN